MSGPAGYEVGFIFIWWLTWVWNADLESYWLQRTEEGGDVGAYYYSLITVLPPPRYFQEPVSDRGIGCSAVLSVSIVNFTRLFTKHCGDHQLIRPYSGAKLVRRFLGSQAVFSSSIRMRGALPHFCCCNVDLNLCRSTGDGRGVLSE